jgi:hypothetical protein
LLDGEESFSQAQFFVLHQIGQDKGSRSRYACHTMNKHIKASIHHFFDEFNTFMEILAEIKSFMILPWHIQVVRHLTLRMTQVYPFAGSQNSLNVIFYLKT